MLATAPYYESLIFQTKLVQIGVFRLRPWYPGFEYAGSISRHLIVFPRTSVRITHAGKQPVVADPNVVMFYNRGQEYRREKLSERGDLCEWYGFAPEVVTEAVSRVDPEAHDFHERPFRFAFGPVEAEVYLKQRIVVEHILGTGKPDALWIEESLLLVLDQVIKSAYRAWRGGEGELSRHSTPAHLELVRTIKAIVAGRYGEGLTLGQIAAMTHYSPYYLCRIFHQQTGFTIHQYLNQVRLRTALEFVTQKKSNLTELALNLGFSSHSHFTHAFRRAFGVPPTKLQDIGLSP